MLKVKAIRPFSVINLDEHLLIESISEKMCPAIRKGEVSVSGFAFREGTSEAYILTDDYLLFDVRFEQRKITSAMIRFEVDRLIRQMGLDRRTMERNDLRDMAEQCKSELSKTVTPTASQVSVVLEFNPSGKSEYPRLFIFSSSKRVAEDVLSLVRETIGSLSVVPWQGGADIIQMMTGWMKTNNSELLSPHLAHGYKLSLVGVDKEKANFSGVSPFSDEPLDMVTQRRMVASKMEVVTEYFSFILGDGGVLTGIQMTEETEEDAKSGDVMESENMWFHYIAPKITETFDAIELAAGKVKNVI